MQVGKTALEDAVDGGYHTVVGYLANQMDVTQFDMVCNTICVCVYVYKYQWLCMCMCTVM